MTKRAVVDEEARRFGSYLALMNRCVDELQTGYVQLIGMVARGTSSAATEGGSAGTSDEVPAPVALGVVDVMTAVERAVAKYVPLVRGALRMGLWDDPAPLRIRTGHGIAFLGRSLRPLYDTDPTLADDVTNALWWLRSDVGVWTGTGQPSFRLEAPCEACGERAVWVRPSTATTRCASCKATGGWSAASLVHTTSSAPQ